MVGVAIVAQAGMSPGTAFDCRIGAGRVTIVADSVSLRYRFRSRGRTGLTIDRPVSSADVGYRKTLYPHAEHRHLRVSNGRYAYVVFSRFHTPDAKGRGAEDRAGLLVLKDGAAVRRLRCDSGGFSNYDADRLPRDPADLAMLADHA